MTNNTRGENVPRLEGNVAVITGASPKAGEA
jgi:hypothetical protein